MSESICRFLSAKSEDSTIQAVRFVYETECRSLTQPFMHPIYVFHIVTKGSAVFCLYPQWNGLQSFLSVHSRVQV